MLNIVNQCQDKNYVAYHTFYTHTKTQSSPIRYTCKNNEEELSDEELTSFMEVKPEAPLFYSETPSNAKELAEDVARIALKQLKEKLKQKNRN